jgi:hypothetical protein
LIPRRILFTAWLCTARDWLPAALQGVPDQAHQGLICKRFSQKADGSGSQGMFFDPLFFVGRNKNNRHVYSGTVHVILDLQAGHPGHLHVDHQTIRIMRAAQGRQKLLAGCKRPDLHTPGVKQTLQGLNHREVIVDDMDEWLDTRQLAVPSLSAYNRLVVPIYPDKVGTSRISGLSPVRPRKIQLGSLGA